MVQDLTLQELAFVVDKHPETLRRLARRGRLPGVYRLGGRWMISREAADRLRKVSGDQQSTNVAGSRSTIGAV